MANNLQHLIFRLPWLAALLVYSVALSASNLYISQPNLIYWIPPSGLVSVPSGSVNVRFNISYDRGWRTTNAPNNWDAIWLFVKFRAGTSDPVLSGVTSTGNLLTIPSAAGLRPGMPLELIAGTGTLSPNTVISAITGPNTISVSPAPTLALVGATVRAQRIWEPANLGSDATHHVGAAQDARTGLRNPGSAYDAITNPRIGAFVYPNGNTSTGFNIGGACLRWEYASQGLQPEQLVESACTDWKWCTYPQGRSVSGVAGMR